MNVLESNKHLSTNIQKVIAEKELKQLAVANKADFSATAFSAMLNGRKMIKPCDALVIAKALDVDMNELYKEGDD